MNTETTYDGLLKQYRDLQLRVTRFSVVEQQLINTRDRLDHELVMYKRLSSFNVDALNEPKECSFYKIVAEAIVDIFEVEAGLSHVRDEQVGAVNKINLEGLQIDDQTKKKLAEEISLLGKTSPLGQVISILHLDLSRFPILSSFSGGFYYQYVELETGLTYTLMGLISKHNSPLYNSIEERHLSFFNVFINQVFNIASNRKKSEKIRTQIDQISQSELELKKLSMIATKTKNGVIIADAEGRVEWVNEAFTKITGFGLAEVVGQKPKEFLQRPGVDLEVQNQIGEALRRHESIEVTIQNFTKNGVPYFNNLQITPILNEEGELANFIAIQRDITKESKFQNDLMRVNSKFELITQKARIGIWEWNAQDQTTFWNDVLRDHYGFSSDYDFEHNWKKFVFEEDYQSVKSGLQDLYSGTTDKVALEYRIYRNDENKSVRILDTLSIAERDDKGNLLRFVGNVMDVTDLRTWQADVLRKNDELKKINAELDNFVYRVSHDLRSPLLAIKGIFSLIFSGNGIDEETEEYLQLADASVNRLDDTIQEILEYSRNSRLEVKLESFDVVDVVKDIYNDLKFSSEKEMDFRMNIECDSIIYSDKARIKVLFKNLVGNSFKYRKKNNSDAFVRFEMKIDGTNIVFKVVDNGEGISKYSIGKIFDMFYRGTSTSVGTGLGLYICKEVLANLNGKIEVESEHGNGTTMIVSLPIVINN
jgi:PAS domain S-box-containing protein